MVLSSLVLLFGLIYAEFKAVSSVFAVLAGQSSGLMAIVAIGLSFFLIASFGAWLIRFESQALMRNLQKFGPGGAMPKPNLLAFIAGVLFIIPGYVSDAAALILLFPPTAWLIRKLFQNRLKAFSESGNFKFYGSFGGGFQRPGSPHAPGASQLSSDPDVIDVEVIKS